MPNPLRHRGMLHIRIVTTPRAARLHSLAVLRATCFVVMASSSSHRDPCAGFFWRGHAVPSQGDDFRPRWKCWASGDSVRWEMRRVLPDIGVVEGRGRHISKQINELWPSFQALSHSLGVDADEMMGRSLRSLVSRQDLEDDGVGQVEQEFWLSTVGLVAVMLFWEEKRRRVDDRLRAIAVLEALVGDGLAPTAAESIDPLDVPVGIRRLCGEPEVAGEGRCSCVQKYVDSPVHRPRVLGGSSSQRTVCNALRHLFKMRACAAIRGQCSSILQAVAQGIEASSGKWGDFEWQYSGGQVECTSLARKWPFARGSECQRRPCTLPPTWARSA